MTSRERAYVDEVKAMIEKGNLAGIVEYYGMIKAQHEEDESGPAPNWQYIYQKCYLHACLKQQHAIAAWFRNVYNELDPISKIALRQVFAYGNYLERRNNPYLHKREVAR